MPRVEPTPADPRCRCAPVYAGLEFTGTWNLSPACPAHGEGTAAWDATVERVTWPWLRLVLTSAAPTDDPDRRDDGRDA